MMHIGRLYFGRRRSKFTTIVGVVWLNEADPTKTLAWLMMTRPRWRWMSPR